MSRTKLAIKMMWILLAFWLVETIVFLILEGWHWKVTSEAEIACNKIFSYGIRIVLMFYLFPLIDLYKKALEDKNIN